MTDATPATPAPDTTPVIPTDAAAIAARDRELTELAERDEPTYRYADGGRYANEHVAIRKAQQVADKATPSAEDGEIDDADVANIDLDATGDDGEGDGPAEGEEAEEIEEHSTLKPWQPPEGQQVADHAKPVLEALDGIATNEEQRDAIVDLLPQLIDAQKAHFTEQDKADREAATAAITERLGSKEAYDGYFATAQQGAKLLPKPLREALKTARTGDGKRLAHMRELIEFLHEVASGQSGQRGPSPPQGSRATMREELAQLQNLMRSDIDAYRRHWRGGKTGSERHLELMRELADEAPAKPSAADVRAEMRRLEQLRSQDPQMFEFGSWPGARSPADRLAAIQSGKS